MSSDGTGMDGCGVTPQPFQKKCLSQSVHTPGGDRLNPWGEAPVPTGARDAPVSNGSGSFYFSRWSFRADGSVDENAWLAGLQSKILPDPKKKNRTDSRTPTCWHRCVGASSPRRTSTVFPIENIKKKKHFPPRHSITNFNSSHDLCSSLSTTIDSALLLFSPAHIFFLLPLSDL